MKIFVSCSSQDSIDDIYKESALELAKEISVDNDFVFGCSNHGLMGIFYREFLKNKRHITGICYEFYKDLLSELQLDEVIMFKTLDENNNNMLMNSDVILILPGAYWTLSESLSAIELVRTKVYDKKVIIYNINGFYDDLFKLFDKMYDLKTTKNNYKDIVSVCNSKEEVMKEIRDYGNK